MKKTTRIQIKRRLPRWMITLLMLYGVFTETGIVTAIAIGLIYTWIEATDFVPSIRESFIDRFIN